MYILKMYVFYFISKLFFIYLYFKLYSKLTNTWVGIIKPIFHHTNCYGIMWWFYFRDCLVLFIYNIVRFMDYISDVCYCIFLLVLIIWDESLSLALFFFVRWIIIFHKITAVKWSDVLQKGIGKKMEYTIASLVSSILHYRHSYKAFGLIF